ncbi:MAG: thioredoxin family protein [Nocardioides sp.]|nr:thioredoxin family protein [Nocardioides sp.]
MSLGLVIVIAAVVVALAFGGYRALTDGRFRGTHKVRHIDEPGAGEGAKEAAGQAPVWDAVAAAVGATERGERATLVQFSSAFCAPCRVTRRVLGEVAEAEPGVVHLEIDAEHHLELVRELGILRTPTTLVLDGAGHEVARAAGAPRKEQVVGAISGVNPAS